MSDAHRDEIAKLEALYADNPGGRIFTHLAEACRKAGDLERAREVLSEGIEQHPDYSSAHVVLGRVLMDQGDHDQARAEFQRVLELDGQNLVAHRSLGDIARMDGQTEEALEHYHQLLDLEPSDREVRELVDELSGGLVVPGPTGEEPRIEEPRIDEPMMDEPTIDEAMMDEAMMDEAEAGEEWSEAGDLESDAWSTEAPAEEAEPWGEAGTSAGTDEFEDTEEPGAGADAEDVDVMTETIAQVYARQGLYDRAAEVYRELARKHPDNEALRDRLAEMEARAADEGVEYEAEGVEADEATVPGIEVEETTLSAAEDAGPVEGFQKVEFDAEEEGEIAPLAGLETEESGPGTPSAEPDAEMEAPEAPDEDGAEPVAEPEPEPWSDPAPWAAELDEGAEAYEAPEASGEAEEPEAPEEAGEPGEVEDEPASPWTGEDWSQEAAETETPYAWADAEDAADGSPPIHAYLKGVLEWGGESAPAPTGSESGAGPEPVEADEAAVDTSADEAGGEAAGEAAPGSDDDDDLEMFRSWLESLKQ